MQFANQRKLLQLHAINAYMYNTIITIVLLLTITSAVCNGKIAGHGACDAKRQIININLEKQDVIIGGRCISPNNCSCRPHPKPNYFYDDGPKCTGKTLIRVPEKLNFLLIVIL